MESGFDFGIGFFTALLAYKLGIAFLIVMLLIIFIGLNWLYLTYKDKKRVCPRCKSNGNFNYHSVSFAGRSISKCVCGKCHYEWCL